MTSKPTYEDLEQRIKDLEKENVRHKQDLKMLSVSDGQKKAILDGFTINLAFVNENLEVIWANTASAESVGKPPSDLIGRKCHEIWADPEKPCEGCPTIKAFNTRKTERTIIQTPDGRVWDEKGEPVFDEKGNLLGVLEMAHDITERKRAEEALRKSERLLDATGRMARVGGWELDAETLEVSWTEETYRIHEVPSQHKPLLEEAIDFFHSDDRDRLSKAIRRALEIGEPYDMVLRFVTAKGKHLWVRTVCQPQMMDGKTVKLIGTFQNITAQKEAEQALRTSERRFRELFDSISDLIYTQDLEGRFLSVNPSLCERFGYEEDELIGRKAAEFMAPEVRALFETEYIAGIKKNGYYEGTAAYFKKDGDKAFVQYRSKLVEPEGDDPYISGIGQDVTQRIEARKERKRLEDELLQARKMEAIASLTGGIAHDYNNLLAIIMGNVSLALQEADTGSQLADFLVEVDKASKKASDLTKELVALSRGSAPVKELIPITPLLRSVSRNIPTENDISVDESISDDLWPIPHDPHKLASVFRNVMANAVEAMPDGGSVAIRAENLRVGDRTVVSGASLKPGDYVHLSIEDEGLGIPKDHLSKLFDPYFSTKPMGARKGMGLGLATAFANVKKHGGYIAVDSIPGKGTVVHIYLPAAPATEGVESGSVSKTDKTPAKKRVLLMDDEEMIRNVAPHMLERLGHEATTAKNGTEAIEVYRKYLDSDEPFDAVILDFTTQGGMGGEETIRELKKMDPNVKAIVCSGHSDDPHMTDFETYGFVAAMAKPYEMKQLKETLEKLFR